MRTSHPVVLPFLRPLDSPRASRLSVRGSRSKWRRLLIWSLVILGGAAIAGAVGIVVLVFHTVALPSVTITTPGPATPLLRSNISRTHTSIHANNPRVFRMDEAQVNSWLETQLAQHRNAARPGTAETLRDVRVKLFGDRMHAYFAFDFRGATVTADIEMKVHSEGGYLSLDVASANLGALPIPRASIETALQKALDSPANREFLRLPDKVRDVYVETGELVAVYK